MRTKFYLLPVLLAVWLMTQSLTAQTTEFTFQGNLKDGTGQANGNYDFEFLLFDSLTGGSQQGATLTRSAVAVANGTFSVKLDFGGQFPGSTRFVEIHVRPTGGGTFTPLTPRQSVGSSPYALQSLNAANAVSATTAATATTAVTANNATQLGGVAADQYTLTTDARLSDARTPTPGSPSYVQNGTELQPTTDFNISGTGTADILVARSQFNILNGNFRILGTSGCQVPCGYPWSNTFVGVFSGQSTVASETAGYSNSFFGNFSGYVNTTGQRNSLFGFSAGSSNTTGLENSYFGSQTGQNTNGSFNSYFGSSTATGSGTASYNAVFGAYGGRSITTGSRNTFLGFSSGQTNTVENSNTLIGSYADISAGVTNASAVGYLAKVTQSNSVVLGSVNGVNGSTSNTNVGIGTTAPGVTLDVQNANASVALRARSTFGSSTLFLDRASAVASNSSQIAFNSAGVADFTIGTSQGSAGNSDLSIYDYGTATNTLTIQRSTGSIGIGTTDPGTPAGENSRFAIVQTDAGKWSSRVRTNGLGTGQSYGLLVDAGTNSSDISFQARSQTGNPLLTVQGGGVVNVSGAVLVGTNAVIPSSGNATLSGLTIGSGGLQIINLSGGSGGAPLCAAGSAPYSIGFCSSSYRYKTNITNYRAGFDVITRLNPIGYHWKLDGTADIGLGAEDVAKVDPRLVFYNTKGEVEGVRYDRLGVVLINATKEQQTQIKALTMQNESQQKQIRDQAAEIARLKKKTSEIDELKAIVCVQRPRAAVCKRRD